jgi:protein O-mannosyl-transferase
MIVLAGTIMYGKSVAYEFTFTDDVRLVALNQDVLDNIANIPTLFKTDAFLSTTDAQLFYRPIMNVLFMMEAQIAGNAPWIYHLTNILLHLACSILLFRVLQQAGSTRRIAALAAVLFCVHPLNTSAVVWIPGRNETLLTLFILGSFSFLLRAVKTNRLPPLLWHFVLFFLALLTKESAVVFPILTISYVYLFHPGVAPRRVWVLGLLGYVLLGGVWFELRSLVPQTFALQLNTGFLLMSSLRNTPAILLYFGKLFFPFNLSIFPNLTDNSLWPGIAGVVLLSTAFLIRMPASIKKFVWGVGWFLLFLIPTFASGYIFFEHRAYSAFFGFLFAVVQLPLVQSLDLSKRTHLFGIVAVLAVFAFVSVTHSEQFHNRTAYATSAYIADPSIDGSYANLAELFIGEGNYDDAERVLRKGLARSPNLNATHRVLADLLSHRHEYEKAAQEYEISLRLNPLQLNSYIVYGKMCLDAGWNDEALKIWKTSVAVNPGFILGYYYLANFYVHVKNDPDSAMIFVRQIELHGATVMPDLLKIIQDRKKEESRK